MAGSLEQTTFILKGTLIFLIKYLEKSWMYSYYFSSLIKSATPLKIKVFKMIIESD